MISLTLPPTLKVTAQQFWEICRANPDVVLELNARGELEQMSPTGWQSGRRNIKIAMALETWVQKSGQGAAFDSSTGFRLPNGSVRSPDAAWVSPEKMSLVSLLDPDSFFPSSPDFVVELASRSDDVERLRLKMTEYLEHGVQLGWLMIPQQQRVEIYRLGQNTEVLISPEQVSADPLLPEFVLNIGALELL